MFLKQKCWTGTVLSLKSHFFKNLKYHTFWRPGINSAENFNTKNLISFQDNFNAKDDFPFVLYFDFETTAPTDNCFDSEQKKIFFVSYVLIVTFHPALKLNRIIIQRSYAHSLEQLTSLNYFSEDQMKFIDVQIIRQLKDIAIDVSKRKCKNMMGQIFCWNLP